MNDALIRMECPACLGIPLEKVAVEPGLDIDHCNRCGGNWILQAHTPQLAAVPRAFARAALSHRTEEFRFLCHGCHAPMERNSARCGTCEWGNHLDCPSCGRAMAHRKHQHITLDACAHCRGIWLDHAELWALWTAAAAAVAHTSGGLASDIGSGLDAADAIFNVLYYGPELVRVSGHALSAGVEAAANIAEGTGGVLSLLHGAGEVAGAVFGAIGDVFSIFDGL
ncbi:zf-TFIIB domain-containing protein [Longimicrobium terrae]|uniref:Zn-finger nucleic acid-binding protein n=1 Tax=Longimicrobium terrae TaxID=1639882 RepID=A0A841GXP6_9BACT|nr:zf-TFIIB domain-containing protein [Longimicrobium terrae]MBB4636122.1 Zn-finger nucleic acid-binding protein [Longimicrobium terrae]MBB6070517.1 Zn-finger nucleic acid-binding protein [Longimicrobium terrae]NNC29507.1 zf-TFIIB domain-containing protein [Longimicrobium terrae]